MIQRRNQFRSKLIHSFYCSKQPDLPLFVELFLKNQLASQNKKEEGIGHINDHQYSMQVVYCYLKMMDHHIRTSF
jgi:hypothetical protein